MVDVIVLCAGASSRFPNSRPKWLLTHPKGKPLFSRAVDGLHGQKFDVHVVVLREHLERYSITEEQLAQFHRCRVHVLDQKTESQVETAMIAVNAVKPRGGIFFKDCDSFFEHEVRAENCVVTAKISKPIHDLTAKCFVESDSVRGISNIVEKRVISDEFAIGGYGFESHEAFLRCVGGLSVLGSWRTEVYMSHVVLAGISAGERFVARLGDGYEDYGTPAALRSEIARYGTIFVDLDGTLLESAGGLRPRAWGTAPPIPGNLAEIARLYQTGRYQVIVTTARPESLRAATEAELAKHCLPFTQLIMGLMNAPRILINDRSPNYPAMTRAVEVQRDTDSLGIWLSDLE